jgi:hypothetical protein
MGHEADNSPPSSAEVNEFVELYIHSPNTPSWQGAQLKKNSMGTTLPLLLLFNFYLKRFLIWLILNETQREMISNSM